MLRTNGFYTKFLNITLRLLYWQAKVLGIFSLRYDRTKRKLVRSKPFVDLTHSLLIYGTIVLLMVIIGSYSEETWIKFVKGSYFLSVVQGFNVCTVLVTLTAIFITNFVHREKITRLAGLIVFLDWKYFKNPKAALEKRVFLKLFGKQVITTLIYIAHSVDYVIRIKDIGKLSLWFWIVGILVGSILETVIHLFYGTTAYLTKYHEILNDKLADVIRESKSLVKWKAFTIMAKSCELCDRLDELGHLYKKIFEAHDGLVDLYQHQVLAIILSTYVNNVVMAFNAYSLFKPRDIDEGGNFHFYVIALCALLHYLDIVLMIDVCHCHISTATNARNAVSKYEPTGLDERLDRSVSSMEFFV